MSNLTIAQTPPDNYRYSDLEAHAVRTTPSITKRMLLSAKPLFDSIKNSELFRCPTMNDKVIRLAALTFGLAIAVFMIFLFTICPSDPRCLGNNTTNATALLSNLSNPSLQYKIANTSTHL